MKFLEELKGTPGRLSGVIKKSEENMIEAMTSQVAIQEKIAKRLKHK